MPQEQSSPQSSLDNVKSYLTEYADLVKVKKAAEARMKELDQIIRPALAGKGNTLVGNYVFTLTNVAGRRTIDKDALIADGIDVSKYEKIGNPSTKLDIKEVNNG